MDYKETLAAALAPLAGLPAGELKDMLETPPDPAMGDFALPCFKLARTMRKAPPAIAQELQQSLSLPSGIGRSEVKGGYLNFFLNQSSFAADILAAVAKAGADYGSSSKGENHCP